MIIEKFGKVIEEEGRLVLTDFHFKCEDQETSVSADILDKLKDRIDEEIKFYSNISN